MHLPARPSCCAALGIALPIRQFPTQPSWEIGSRQVPPPWRSRRTHHALTRPVRLKSLKPGWQAEQRTWLAAVQLAQAGSSSVQVLRRHLPVLGSRTWDTVLLQAAQVVGALAAQRPQAGSTSMQVLRRHCTAGISRLGGHSRVGSAGAVIELQQAPQQSINQCSARSKGLRELDEFIEPGRSGAQEVGAAGSRCSRLGMAPCQ